MDGEEVTPEDAAAPSAALRADREPLAAVAPMFDAVIHPPPRLQIWGLLAAVDTMEFALVRNTPAPTGLCTHSSVRGRDAGPRSAYPRAGVRRDEGE